jgi:rsbT co-antagonist protein RsbR
MTLTEISAQSQGLFFQEHPDHLVIIDANGAVLAINEAARRALGPDVAPGSPIAARAHPDDRAKLNAALGGLAASQSDRVACRLQVSDGSHAASSVSLRRAGAEPWVYVQISSTSPAGSARPGPPNDTKAGHDGRTMEQEAAILRALLEHMAMVVWAIDEGGRYTYQEGKGLAAMGLSPRQNVGQNMFEVYGYENSKPARRALEGEHVHSVIQLSDFFWESWMGPWRDKDGHTKGVIGISLDVSEMERAKADLESKRELIERQQDVIRNLETPILQVWDGVLTLPMIGIVDSRRAARVMDDLLSAVTRYRARYAILDVTGVEVVDTATANHLLSMIRAVRLLGAEGILTGIRPSVAQTVVSLGVDLSNILTLSTLRDGLSMAIRRMAE